MYKDQGTCLIFNVTEQSKIGVCTHIPVIHDEKCPILTLITEEVDEIYKKFTFT